MALTLAVDAGDFECAGAVLALLKALRRGDHVAAWPGIDESLVQFDPPQNHECVEHDVIADGVTGTMVALGSGAGQVKVSVLARLRELRNVRAWSGT